MADDDSHPFDQPSGPEGNPAYRTRSQRDRDRILYSSAFRRLAGITQVATPEIGHEFHNRLTHTLKVSQAAVRLAQRLLQEGANPALIDVDTVDAAACGHDLGHPPFGHVAERVLNDLGDPHGGFEGNAQSFRVVTKLAVNKSEIWGLGLTARTLNALLKYPWLRGENRQYPDKWGAYESEQDEFLRARYGHAAHRRSLEAEIMDWADDVTFAVHDLEDFFRAGLIPLDRVVAGERERGAFVASMFQGGDHDQGLLLDNLVRDGLDAGDVDAAVEYLFDEFFVRTEPFKRTRDSRSEIRRTSSVLISRFDRRVSVDGDRLQVPQTMRAEVAVLKQLTWHYVINRPSLAVVQEGQRVMITELFKKYSEAAQDEDRRVIFPALEREQLTRTTKSHEQHRIVLDLISGLTEAMVYELHHRLTGVSRGSILDSAARATR